VAWRFAQLAAEERLPSNSVGECDVELSYDDALATLREHNTNEGLVKHGIAVGAAVRAYARKFGEDENKWRIAGLLHDMDYEKHPTIEEHGKVGADWLRDLGYPDDVVHAVHAHNDYHGVPRDDLLSKTVFACDELTGLVTACALVRPDKSLSGLEVSSVRKKMKDKAFARGVNREDIVKGAQELGVDLDEHIALVIAAMQQGADALGLAGATN
jgi:putative nucleotidyltransferase with HDIG domain